MTVAGTAGAAGEAGTAGAAGEARTAGATGEAQATLWVPGRPAVLTGGLGLVLLGLGVALSRPDLAALAVPMVLAVAWAWFSRPRAEVPVSVRPGLPAAGAAGEVSHAPEAGAVCATVDLQAPPGTSVVRLRVATAGYRPVDAVVAGTSQPIGVSLRTARTGILECFRVDYVATAHDELFASHAPAVGPIPMLVRPPARALRRGPLPHRLQGLVGPHTSRRVGEGMELHDIHEFTPGDRLRRIDWRTTVRRSWDPRTRQLGTLYVRRTLASADATVMLVVDSRDDVGPDVATWGGGDPALMTDATSVDLAREAATSVARFYLRQGDRVGLDDLGRRRRPVAPAAGSGHLERISQRLARIAPEGSPKPRQRSPRLPSGALAVIFSTFLDDEAGTVEALWRTQGHRVIAVDVLPPVHTTRLDPYAATSYQLTRLERGVRLADLRRQGIDVIHWAGNPDGHGGTMGPDEAFMVAAAPRRAGR